MDQTPAVMENSGWTAGKVAIATLLAIAVATAFWLIYHFRVVVLILFLAIVLSTAIRPSVEWLCARGIPRAAGVIIIYALLLAGFIAFLLLVMPKMIAQGVTLIVQLPTWYRDLRQAMLDSTGVFHQLATQLPPNLPIDVLIDPSGGLKSGALVQIMAYINAFSRWILAAMAISILAFYWTLESKRIFQYALLFVPLKERETVRKVIVEIQSKVGSYVRAEATLMLAVGFLATIAYIIIGLPYVLMLGLFAGLLELVPVVGPALGAIPATMIALPMGFSKVIWVIIATIAIQAFENSVLVPRIMRKAVGVNPVVTLVALAAFSSLLGFAGALLAVPLAAIIQLLFNRFIFTKEEPQQKQLFGRDYISMLRYNAQELAHDARKQINLGESNEHIQEIQDSIEIIAEEIDTMLSKTERERVSS